MSTNDPETAKLPMQMTWAASDNVGIVSQHVWLEILKSDDEYEDYSAQLTSTPRAHSFDVWANDGSEAGCSGGVSVEDAAGNSADSCLQYSAHFDEAASAFTLSQGWTVSKCNCWMNGQTLKSSTVGASASFIMGGNRSCDNQGTPGNVGDSRAVIADFAAGRGTAKVYVDGRLTSTISEDKPTANRVVIFQKRFKGYTTNTHTVKIVVASGRFDLDGLERQSSWYTDGCGG